MRAHWRLMKLLLRPLNRSLELAPGRPVLESALAAHVNLPHSCRGGNCGSCRARLLSGRIDYPRGRTAGLSEAEAAAGYVLLCQAVPLTDLVVEAREIRRATDVEVKSLPCRVERLERLAPDVMGVYLRLPAVEDFRFSAGQYLDVLLPGGRRRSFSIASPPHDAGLIELHVRRVAGGQFTAQVFESLARGALLRIEGPLGQFVYREPQDAMGAGPLLLVAGGTGFAPIKAVIEHAIHQAITRPMVLYWGVRSLVDLYLPRLPGHWQQQQRDFTFIPVLSDPRPEDHWPGRTGLVHKAVMADFTDLSGYQVYACGGPAMIEAARKDFTEQRRLPPEEFFADSFTYAVQPEAST